MDLKKVESINRTVMDSVTQRNVSAPAAVVRRYKRTSSKPTTRDQTPDPSSRTQSTQSAQKNTDDESCSSADFFFAATNNGRSPSVSVPTSPTAVTAPSSPFKEMSPLQFPTVPNTSEILKSTTTPNVTKFPEVEAGGHMSKILSRRNKAKNTDKAHRSQSTPRKESETQTSTTAVITCTSEIPIGKRSMSVPRHKEDSSESDAALVARLTIPAPAYTPQFTSNSSDPTDTRGLQLEMNLRKFEEDRQRFELEKLRFVQQKRELDRMRLARFDKYKQEIATKEPTKGLTPFSLHVKDSGVRPDSPMPKKTSKSKERRYKMKKYTDYVSSTADSSDCDDSDHRRKIRSRKTSKSPRRRPSKSPRRPVSKTPDITIECPDESFDINKNSIQEFGKALQVRRRTSVQRKSETETKTSNGVSNETSLTQPKTNGELADTNSKTKELLTPIFVDAHSQKPDLPKTGVKSYVIPFWYEAKVIWRQLKAAHPQEVRQIWMQFRRCICMLMVMLIMCGLGGIAFRYLEGNWENMYKCGTKRVRRNFIDDLWKYSQNLRFEGFCLKVS